MDIPRSRVGFIGCRIDAKPSPFAPAYTRVLKVARTIADLSCVTPAEALSSVEGAKADSDIKTEHIAEAIQ